MVKIDKFLDKVQKPAQYIGGEVNSIVKDLNNVDYRFGFCFPDKYEVGMSHLGLKILYGALNELKGVWCERVFCPDRDMEAVLYENNLSLFALESKDELAAFDMLGFTLQTELSFTNVLNVLDLGKIPLRSKDRGEDDPIVIGGGPVAYNPEPICDFFDLFNLGEGEEMLPEIVRKARECKKQGLSRFETLKSLSQIEGVYVPSFYEVTYNDDGTLKERKALYDFAPETVKKRVVENLDTMYFPDKFIVPFCDIVHDRVMLEVFRGCTRGCRFCQAGNIYRPIREKSVETLNEQARKLIESTGYDEISLTSLSTSDYTQLFPLADTLLTWCEPSMVSLSLPSLRVDNFSTELMDRVQKVRKGGLTFAPEAGTQRMRDIINKNVTEEELKKTCRLAFAGGWHAIKLYFMMGLPHEKMSDVAGIAELGKTIVDEYYDGLRAGEYTKQGGVSVKLSVACFIPKPFTAFQWAAQDSMDRLHEKQSLLSSTIKDRKITLNYHDANVSYVEAILARGDRRLNDVIETAFRKGAKMDNWTDSFRYDIWLESLKEHGLKGDFYACRERNYDELLPWDFIDVGVTKAHLIRESEKSCIEATTPDCRTRCAGCGADKLCGGNCHAKA